MSKLPSGWKITTILDITEYLSRGKQPKYVSHSSLPVINQKAIRWSGIQNEYLKYVDPVQFDRWTPDRFIKSGDILWNSTGTGTLGRACLITQSDLKIPKVVDSHVTIVRPDSRVIHSHFLFFCIQRSEVQENIISLATGATNQIELSRSAIASISIPIAPLSEQQRIADKLDALLTRLATCQDRLDRIPRILKRFRQSVFDGATSGELTKDWLYKSNPETWQNAAIGELLLEKPRNGYSPRPVEFVTETRSLALTAITSGRFDPKYIKYIDEKIPENSYLWLEPDDILVQRANTIEYVGVSAIYDGESKGCIYPDLMMKCKANDRVETKFLYYLLSSSRVRSYLRKNATGTAGNMPKINQQTIISAPVKIPPIDEQNEIIRCVEILLAYADRIEAGYKRACTKIDRLTPVLLDMAFRGELVPQDPSDEPASVLLERIRTAKAAQPIQPRVSTTRKSTMNKKLSTESVQEVIDGLPNDRFSFDELRNKLREEIPSDYDSLQDILFKLLDQTDSTIEQVFDRGLESMQFVRGSK